MSAGGSATPGSHHVAEIGVALGWVLAGCFVAVAAWRMDRLEALSINPYSVPGLVPGIAGVLMALFGLIVAARAWRARPRAVSEAGPPDKPALGRALAVAALCVVFGGLLPGRGLPFVLVGGAFIFIFILCFGGAPGTRFGLRPIASAAAIAAVASVLITHLFGDVFLVRLP